VETFSKRNQPVDAEEVVIPDSLIENGEVSIPHLLVELGLAEGTGKARRLIEQGGVSLDGEKVSDGFGKVSVESLRGKVLRAGKHQFRKLV
jgi:tyrosyl-tRNA synthetase